MDDKIPVLAYICSNNSRKRIMLNNPPVYIRSLMLKDYKCFKGENNFYFCQDENSTNLSQCTVILGNNGTGKTNILKVIANLEPEPEQIDSIENKPDIENYFFDITMSIGDKPVSPDFSKEVKYKPIVVERHNIGTYSAECNFLIQTSSRKNIDKSSYDKLLRYKSEVKSGGKILRTSSEAKLGYTRNVNFVDPTKSLSSVRIDAYGTNRHSVFGTKTLGNKYNSETLFFENNNLIDIEYWILQLDTAKQHKRPGASGKYNKVRNMIRHSNLFPGVNDIEIGFDDDNNSFVYFITDDGKFRLNELGYGYQCMFSWIFDFCKKMFDRYPNSDNPLHEPAILLMDEIDMHLHPSWQRLILSELCNMFPMTQFIVTTHSPLIVQSMKKINLYVLSNKSDGIEIRRYQDMSFQGWTVEEILRELMDLGDDVRSDEYIKLIDKFKSALQSGNSDEATSVYKKLSDILHPNSIERELYPMQIEGIDDKRYD